MDESSSVNEKKVTLVISYISHEGNIFTGEESGTVMVLVLLLSVVPQYKCWHFLSESRGRLV